MPMCSFNDTATTEISPLSRHVARPTLPPMPLMRLLLVQGVLHRVPVLELLELVQHLLAVEEADGVRLGRREAADRPAQDRKSTSLNSSHAHNSDAVFFLKKTTIPKVPS